MKTQPSPAVRRALSLRLFTLLLLFATAPAASAQDAAHVRVGLSLSGEKKVYRAGEAVRLVMSFTSEREGYQLDTTTTKPPHVIDTVSLAPDAGAYAWAEQYTGGSMYHPDYASVQTLAAKPTTVAVTLNDWYRFDRAGRYTVKVATSRVMGPGPAGVLRLTTNEVSFEIIEMSEAEEAAEVSRISAALDRATGWQEQARLADELAYLAGEPSTREKVRRYVGLGRYGRSDEKIFFGLVMARDRALAVRLLEAAVRDTTVTPTYGLLQAAAALRLMLEGVPRPPMTYNLTPEGHPRSAELLREYVAELLSSLPKRRGENRKSALMAALSSLPRDAAGSVSVPPALRDLLVGEFDSFHPYAQELLLRVYWEQLRDPVLLPGIERILVNRGAQDSHQVRAAALRRLSELSMEKARPYILAEIRDPSSFVEHELLAALPDETLPEVDDALLEQIKALAPLSKNADSVMLRHKTMLAARYGSPAIYDGLLEAYRAWGEKWQPDARGAVLGYLARHNPGQALPLVEQALAQVGRGRDSSLLLEVTRPSYPAALRELLRRRLEGDDPQAVGAAAYVMSQHGAEGDQQLLETRLERWRKEWGGHAAELDAQGGVAQRMVEVNLVSSLLHSKAWKLPKEKAAALTRACVTQDCRRYEPK